MRRPSVPVSAAALTVVVAAVTLATASAAAAPPASAELAALNQGAFWPSSPFESILEADLAPSCGAALLEMLTQHPKMIDATGKLLNSGLLKTVPNTVSMGDYAECVAEAPFAKYCFVRGAVYASVNATLPTKPKYHLERNITAPVQWGACVPSACSADELSAAFASVPVRDGNTLRIYASPSAIICAHATPWTGGVKATIAVMALLAALLLAASLYDILVVRRRGAPVDDGADLAGEKGSVNQDAVGRGDDESRPLLQQPALAPRRRPAGQGEGSKAERALMSFSVPYNAGRLFNTTVAAGQMGCLNGLRTLSMQWVVLGHCYYWLLLGVPLDDYGTFLHKPKQFMFQFISNGMFSVDSFFTISGFLVALLTLRVLKKDGTVKWGMFYFHRYWRLTPLYGFSLLIFVHISPLLGSGPLWYMAQGSPQTVYKYWWTNLLYINNLYPNKMAEEAMGWAWYLANDMQFYWISPILLLLIHKVPRVGVAVVMSLLAASIGVVAGIAYHHKYAANSFVGLADPGAAPADQGTMSDLLYVKPYARIQPYLVGLLAGAFMAHVEQDLVVVRRRFSLPIRLVGWALCAFLMISSLFGTYSQFHGHRWSLAENVFYIATTRAVWGLGLSWIILMCLLGHGGLLNTFLAHPIWTIPSRLSFAVYMMHPIVIGTYYFNLRYAYEYSDLNTAFVFISVLLCTYAVAAVLSLAVESPMIGLEKVLIGKHR